MTNGWLRETARPPLSSWVVEATAADDPRQSSLPRLFAVASASPVLPGSPLTAIWLLSSRGRPREAQATIDACQEAGMTSLGVLYVDGSDDYHRIRLPGNWKVHYEPQWRGLQGSLQWCLKTFPDASQYGWLADDTRPQTQGWDGKLEEAAGDWHLAYARDLWLSEDPCEEQALIEGYNLSAGLCWGGDLVRLVGWWALPGVFQAGIDTTWTELVRPLQLHRYDRSVIVEHLHLRSGKRGKDSVDGGKHIDKDITIRNAWVWSKKYRRMLKRLHDNVPKRGDPDPVWNAMRQSLVDQLWQGGKMPGARLHRILEAEIDVHALDAAFFGADTDEEPAGVD